MPEIDLKPSSYKVSKGRKWRRGPPQKTFIALGLLTAGWCGFFLGYGHQFFDLVPYQILVIAHVPVGLVLAVFAVWVELSDDRG